ncbi:cytochrome P450 [Rugosimonospora acidiphila]|uniref:Cytochrome P450 n=1 Tax=Rugosimonospora acidiphila TaxID=556531 RepID=A0ABP9RPM8_9ACTN
MVSTPRRSVDRQHPERQRPDRPTTIPAYRTLPGLFRAPLRTLTDIGQRAGGSLVRVDLGLVRPYLVWRPEHVQHVLVDHADNYLRDGMMWKPLRRLIGHGLASGGPEWQPRRRLIQPMFSAHNIATLIDLMSETIAEAVAELDPVARTGRPVDACLTMTRIVNRAVIRAFFGDRISAPDADRLGQAIAVAFTSLGPRMLLPFVPDGVPVPGDRAFARAVRTVDDIMFPLVRQCREQGAGDSDIASLLCRATDENGGHLDDRQVRDDVVAMFVGGSETTAVALTWLWIVLDQRPDVAARLYEEIDGVVGSGTAGREHLGGLRYTGLVLQELLRLYPVGWIIPRTAARPDVIDGVRVRGGAPIIISPYLTHRSPRLWERPDEFDPERFAPDRRAGQHRFAYYPFSGGAHRCLGSHFFTVEAQLIVAALLARFRPARGESGPVAPRAAVNLRPNRPIDLVFAAKPGGPVRSRPRPSSRRPGRSPC